MTKTWEQMSQPEKIEDLRKEIMRLFDALNSTNRNITSLSIHVGEADTAVKKVSTELAALKARIAE